MQIIKVDSLGEQVYKLIKSKILNNEYCDQTVLNERTLSEELQVSRTPVREALKALEAEGWVAYVPYKGVEVKKMTPQEVVETSQIRRALEVLMVELAMPNVTDVTIASMEVNVRKQAENTCSKRFKAFLELDTEFHSLLLEATHNEMLKKFITDIRDKSSRLGMSSLFNSEARFEESYVEHCAILEAVKSGDVAQAKAAMNLHMQRVFETATQYSNKETHSGR